MDDMRAALPLHGATFSSADREPGGSSFFQHRPLRPRSMTHPPGLEQNLEFLTHALQEDSLQPEQVLQHPELAPHAALFEAARLLTEQVQEEREQQRQEVQILQTALREAAVAVWNWDLETQEGWWSQELLDLFEVPEGAPLPETLHARIRHKDFKRMQEALRGIRRGEAFPKLVMPLQLPSGTRRILAMTGVVLEGRSGRQLAGQVQDITTLADLHEEQHHLSSLQEQLGAMGISVMRYDPKTRRYQLTPHLLETGLFGATATLTPEEFQRFFRNSVHPEDQGVLLRYEEELASRGEGYQVRFRCWLHQHWNWLELLAQQVEAGGASEHRLYLIRDIDEEVALQHEFERQERETSLWLIGQQFLHELSTPLTSISMALEFLQSKRPEGVEKPVQQALAARDQIHLLLSNLRKLMRATRFDELYEINTVEMATRVSSFLGGLARHCGAAVELEIEPNLPCFRGRELGVLQALLCLIENGCEAQQSISVQKPLQVRFRCGEQELLIEVEDFGPGISRELQPLILYRGFTTKSEGTGYGLSMIQNIVDQHQGSLELLTQTPEHPGTLFRIHLPELPPTASSSS